VQKEAAYTLSRKEKMSQKAVLLAEHLHQSEKPRRVWQKGREPHPSDRAKKSSKINPHAVKKTASTYKQQLDERRKA